VDVIILAGGYGKRLESVWSGAPKCLAPIQGAAALDLVIKWLQGIRPGRIVVAAGYEAAQLRGHVKEMWRWHKVDTEFHVVEREPDGIVPRVT